MQCIVINFMLVFILDTNKTDTAIVMDCFTSGSEEKRINLLMNQNNEVEVLSYNHEEKLYYVKIKKDRQ